MSRRANPTVIGAFVVGALALLIIGVVFLSPGVGEDRERYQLYFNGSVKGLDVGAPVLVKGVRVGSVRDVSLRMDTNADNHQIGYVAPVIIELSRRHLLSQNSTDADIGDLIDKGLRAQLELDSLVTQKMFIKLDFLPGTQVRLYTSGDTSLQEIPTVQTSWQSLQASIEDVDIAQLVAQTASTLESIHQILSGPEIVQIIHTLEQSLNSINVLVTGLEKDRELLSENLQLTLNETRATFAAARKTLQQADQMLQGGNAVVGDARDLVERIDGVVANLDTLTGENSPTVYRAEVALDEITDTAQAMRRFLEMLERKPNALIHGR